MSDAYRIGTKALHAGQAPDPATGSRAVPIYQTTSYVFHDSDHAARLFDLAEFGFIYTRIGNPTQDALEQRLAALEGGTAAVAFASGSAAVTFSILNITQAGQNIVSSPALYGGTVNLFAHTFPRFGIGVKWVDLDDIEALRAAIDDNTRLVFTESLGNPKNNVGRLDKIADAAHEAGIPVVIDNTVTTPYLFRPFEWGADISVHSLTKYLGGHGNSIGGAVIDSGKFNWDNGKFPELTEPDPSYHGLRFWEVFGNLPGMGNVAYALRLRATLLRDVGACISPFNAFLFLQGIETLHVRMPRHCENAQALAEWLEGHPAVTWVNYPGLRSHPDHERAKRYLPNGCGAIVGFGIRGGLEAGKRFIDSVKLCSHLANLGDAKTLVLHPASTAHRQLSQEARLAAGVTDDYVRLSVGLEDVEDIKADIDQALKASQTG